ncbi:hypothetical protein Cs7R123_75740 [Catellatospora sp. TT07R-123]|nr:hypothetical protein Cs7R123_75740 [Catellatospora sp. TT07R-123]
MQPAAGDPHDGGAGAVEGECVDAGGERRQPPGGEFADAQHAVMQMTDPESVAAHGDGVSARTGPDLLLSHGRMLSTQQAGAWRFA